MPVIRSKDNASVRRWQRLVRDGAARRDEQRAVIEGPHLVEAWAAQRGGILRLIIAESALQHGEVAALRQRSAVAAVIVSDAVMRAITDVRTPQGIAAEISIPLQETPLSRCSSCVFLDAVQDAGNVGAILRSAAAFGIADFVHGPGCADPWSPKVLRAAAGSHPAMRLRAAADLGHAIEEFGGRVYWTAPRGGVRLEEADLGGRTGWVFGSEGSGVAPGVARRTCGAVTIAVPGAAESLNVAAAAAICLYEQSSRRRGVQ